MNIETVTPTQLHRSLERAKDAGDERENVLASTLRSQNLAVIRRIPELLSPLFDEEKEMVARWAEGLTQAQDVSNRDFAFHLMVNCEVPAKRILMILEQNQTFSRRALEHIQQMLQTNGPVQQLDDYLHKVAETLLDGEQIPSRDRGRHMLMTLARTTDDWSMLARRFSETEVADLRQKVLERFLQECPDGAGLTLFVENVVKMCLDCIHNATEQNAHKEASHMHWVLTCLERVDQRVELAQVASLFKNRFGLRLPRSVQYRVEGLFPKVPMRTVRRPQPGISIVGMPRIPKPSRTSEIPSSTLDGPRSVEEALALGWRIYREVGKRQVVLEKDGRFLSRHRPKERKRS